jgi:hypothetical protein
VLTEQGQQVGRRPAGVEGAANRTVAEAVDGRAAGRLHVGRHPQPGREVAAKRPRRHGGQVGLEQHVVERLRQQAGERADRAVHVACQQLATRRAQRAATDQPEDLRLVQ